MISKESFKNLKLIAILVIGALLVGSMYFTGAGPFKPPGETEVYFNAYTDLPSETVILTWQNENETTRPIAPIHELLVGETYDLYFTIQSLEHTTTNYTYEIESIFFEETKNVSIEPRESRTIHAEITPEESHKFKEKTTTKESWENQIDITKNAWLAEKKEFQVLVSKGALLTITEERYDLPLSFDVGELGKIYHIDMTLDELKKNQFVKEYTTESIKDLKKTKVTDLISLSVVGDKLLLKANRTRTTYTSEKERFVIQLYYPKSLGKYDLINGLQKVDDLDFWYVVK